MGRRYKERRQKKTPYFLTKQSFKEKKYGEFIVKATKYLERVPQDVEMRFMRAKSYRKLNRFDEAIEDLKYILDKGINNHALTELYYIYYYRNMYKDAIELLPLMYKTKCINSYSISISEMVMKKQLGYNINLKEGYKCDYIKSQIYEYNQDLALQHLSKHINPSDNEISIFNDNININVLFDAVRKNIKNSQKVNKEEILEVHYFAVPNVGTYNGINCNFIKVVVVPQTNNIITMYPVESTDVEYLTNLDCNYDMLFKKDNKSKVKSMSQIDKFNRRFNRV